MMFKVREVTVRNYGVFQHYVRYRRNYREVVIPRSAKAYRLHFIMAFLKPAILAAGIIFLPTPSMTWRIIGGILLALLISNLIYVVAHTRSKTSYLMNWFQIIKIVIWMSVIISQTTYYPCLVFYTEDFLGLYLLLMLFFLDMILDLILRAFPFYHQMYIPILKQPEVVEKLFKRGFQNYLETPLWSTIYPFFRWLI